MNIHKFNEKAYTFIDPEKIEPEARGQIDNISKMPFIFKHVAVMPDCHFGKGATVGTVIATKGAIIPAAVGVDIGCGMIAVRTNLKREQLGDLSVIRHSIERSIPMSAGKFNNKITESAQARIEDLERMLGYSPELFDKLSKNWRSALGTLGGGNHFIEVCLDEEDTVWVTLHSGSRGIGNAIGTHYIKLAQEMCAKMLIELPDKDLSYLPLDTIACEQYLDHLAWAQRFAKLNRDEMMDRVLKDISYAVYGENGHQKEFEVERINCHHNFSQIENHFGENVWITRKGAIQAGIRDKGMIPGSMGTRSYIVTGLGNPMSFNSAPHGAGRRMSRTKASATFTMDDFDKAMVGIEHRRADVLLDEIPQAYKDIDEVMENAKDLVKIEHTLRQIINVKGD